MTASSCSCSCSSCCCSSSSCYCCSTFAMKKKLIVLCHSLQQDCDLCAFHGLDRFAFSFWSLYSFGKTVICYWSGSMWYLNSLGQLWFTNHNSTLRQLWVADLFFIQFLILLLLSPYLVCGLNLTSTKVINHSILYIVVPYFIDFVPGILFWSRCLNVTYFKNCVPYCPIFSSLIATCLEIPSIF